MAIDQTTVQNEKSVQIGSARIEYRPSRATTAYVNLGVGDGSRTLRLSQPWIRHLTTGQRQIEH